jgi:hypothetical protein
VIAAVVREKERTERTGSDWFRQTYSETPAGHRCPPYRHETISGRGRRGRIDAIATGSFEEPVNAHDQDRDTDQKRREEQPHDNQHDGRDL